MKVLFFSVLIGLLLAGCASAPRPGAPNEALAATASASPLPPDNTAGPSASSRSLPLAVTVRPPAVPIGPVAGTPVPGLPTIAPAPVGWQTFNSPALGVSVNYPPDWSAAGQADGAAFASPQGATVRLQAVQAGTQPGSRSLDCNTLINSYGQSLEVCLDPIAQR